MPGKSGETFADVQLLFKFKFEPCGLERHANTCNVDNPDSEVAAGGGRRRRAAAAAGGATFCRDCPGRPQALRHAPNIKTGGKGGGAMQ